MKLAIYDRQGSFSDRWIAVCRAQRVPFVTVDLLDDSLFELLRRSGAEALLCHPRITDKRARLAASAIVNSINADGQLAVFPTPADYWHYEDKIAQKYVFASIGIATPETHVFFDRDQALSWVTTQAFPLVFKLRAGIGSINVSMVRTRKQATRCIQRMFGRGYAPYAGARKDVTTKLKRHKRKGDWFAVLKRAPATLARHRRVMRAFPKDRGYVYFQQFVNGCEHDTCVIVIGDMAFAFRRAVRPNDFRASGSGADCFDPTQINAACIRVAFDAASRLGTTCMSFDLVEPSDGSPPLVVEMSYEFAVTNGSKFGGYWTRDLVWHNDSRWPQDVILDGVLAKLTAERESE